MARRSRAPAGRCRRRRRTARARWIYGPGGPAWSFRLPDRRWVVARAPIRHRHPAIGLILFLGGVTLAVAIGAYPVVRGLTRRLERLQAGVETLGAGNLTARVKVEGKDEVARLAESFNRAAGRIEDLVGAHRMLLANASHELRTPLSRIRLGVELFEQSKDPKYKAAIEQDIAELDSMIDEILLASRLEATRQPQAEENVDLLALAAEEGARYDNCTVEGEAVMVRGERRLLSRLVRNLIENAVRHGAPPVNVHGPARLQHRGAGGDGRRRRHSGGRARTGVLAVPPPSAGHAGRRARPCAGAADRAAAWRRCSGRAAQRSFELLPCDACRWDESLPLDDDNVRRTSPAIRAVAASNSAWRAS